MHTSFCPYIPQVMLAINQYNPAPLSLPPYWLVLPFVALLLMIATGPLFFPSIWHKHYPKISLLLASFVVTYYQVILGNSNKPIEAVAEYVQFMSLIAGLYMATSGVFIKLNLTPTPCHNIMLLMIGAIAANLIGTTGASMLFIRPYIALNKGRIQAYHIVFFIFIVSNVGGALTPIGDPPLFLGFLKGIPFGWTLLHNSFPWFIAITLLLSIFYFLDKKNKLPAYTTAHKPQKLFSMKGGKSLIWLTIIIASVFLDPSICPWLPTIAYGNHHLSFIRELIMLTSAFLAYCTADKEVLHINEFSIEPLKEVTFIFIGIFGTMIPALELIGLFAQSTAQKWITPTTLYWGTGIFSSILDNAPTYLNAVAASMAAQGATITSTASVKAYALGTWYPDSLIKLNAISLAAVFFGAMTYIGNGPNFMVKSIAQQAGVAMPSFGKYIWHFSLPFLFPILLTVWGLFFS